MFNNFFKKTSYNPKLIYIATLLGIFVPIYVIFVDYNLIKNNVHEYIIGRLITAAICSFVFVQVAFLKKQYNWQLPLMFLVLCGYGIHGQWFLPCYYLAYIQVVVGFALFFPIQKGLFYAIVGSTSAAMIYSICYSPATYNTISDIDYKFRFDAIAAVVIIDIISISCYHFVTSVRHLREKVFSKFSDIGKNATSILHDFKGFIQPPLFLIEEIKGELQGNPEALSKVEELENELIFMKNYLREFNHIYTSQELRVEKVPLKEMEYSVTVILRSKIQGIKLTFDDSVRDHIEYDKNLIIKILYNSITNAIEANRNVGNLEIIVKPLSEKELMISDNGKGINPVQLKNLNEDKFIKTDKFAGSGIGMFLSKDILKTHGAIMKFSNNPQGGACINIKFP